MTPTPRAALLALSGNAAARRFVTHSPLLRRTVRRFVAGETLADALHAARDLQTRHVRAALDYLGENVSTVSEARAAAHAYVQTLQAGLADTYISVKLTALGMDLSSALAADNLAAILDAARGAFVCVDMEGSAYTQQTLEIVQDAHRAFPNIGTVLQSALYRTNGDLDTLLAEGITVRLVKGAYAEPPTVAYSRKADVDAAYVRQMHTLLASGTPCAIATHDEAILRDAKRFVREHRVPNNQFEFQMLLGIRRDLQETLAAEGYRVRAYVPFGRAWYSYFMRRLAERPANALFILKNVLRP